MLVFAKKKLIRNVVEESNAFILSINTTLGGSLTIDLPLPSGQTYDFWWNPGDGSPEKHVTAYNDANASHTYSSDYTGQIKIGIRSGDKVGGWAVSNTGTIRSAITSVDQWGDVGFDSFGSAFSGCQNLSSIPNGPITGVTNSVNNLNFAFYNTTALNQTLYPDLFENFSNVNVITNCFEFSAISGAPPLVSYMPNLTTVQNYCNFCVNLTSIPDNYFFSNKLITNYQRCFQLARNVSIGSNLFDLTALSIVTNFNYFINQGNTSYRSTGTVQDIWNYATSASHVDTFKGQTLLTNYASIPFDWKGMVEVGTLTTDQTTLQQVGINRTYTGIAEINWGDGEFTRTTSGVEALHDYASAGIYDIKLAASSTTATTVLVADNCRLTEITGLKTGLLTNFRVNSNLLSSLDMSDAPISGTFYANVNSSLSSITFATSGNGIVASFRIQLCNFTSINLSNVPLSGTIVLAQNPLFTTIIYASSGNGSLTSFAGALCSLPNQDFSTFGSSDGANITIQDNAMTSTEVDNQLINLDGTGWINGTLNIAGTNAARTSASDTAYNNLIANGWAITVN